jgi:hypothetical protein
MQVANRGIAAAVLVALVGLSVATFMQPVRAKGDNEVTVVNGPTAPVPVTGQVSVTFPPVQTVAGNVTVANLPATQAVTGTVNIGNFPLTQNVIAPLAPFGVYNNTVVFPGPTPAQQFVVTPNHDTQIWVSVAAVAPPGQAVMMEIINFSNTTLFQFPTQLVRHDATCGCDILSGTAPAPIYIPANSNLTLALTHDQTVVGFFQGSMTLSGIQLN